MDYRQVFSAINSAGKMRKEEAAAWADLAKEEEEEDAEAACSEEGLDFRMPKILPYH